MRISAEGKIGIALALFFGAGGAATMIWPDQKLIGWAIMAFSLFGFAALFLNHFFVVERRSSIEFTTKTIPELFEVYNGHTSLRGDMLFSQYIGLWITVSGVPHLMKKQGNNIFVTLNSDPLKIKSDVVFTLPLKYEKALARLDVNEPITVVGRIKSANKSAWLRLEKCRLISTGFPALPLPIPAPSTPPEKTTPQTPPSPTSP